MTFFTHLLFAFLTAFVLALVFVPLLGWRRPGGRSDGALATFFVFVFLSAWLGGLWLTPIGPPVWDTPWLSFLVVGLFGALLLSAAAPPPPRGAQVATGPEDDPRVADEPILNTFFWVLLLASVVLLLAAYV